MPIRTTPWRSFLEQTKSKYAGIPVSEERLKEWRKSFSDVEESIEALYKREERVYNEGTKKPKRRNQI